MFITIRFVHFNQTFFFFCFRRPPLYKTIVVINLPIVESVLQNRFETILTILIFHQELISEVLKLQPWYNNVIDIIKHFVAKNFVLKQLDSEFFKTDYNTNVKVL